MDGDKKITKEDTWRPADLRRHLRDEGHGDHLVRRSNEKEGRSRGGESSDRRHRDPEKDSRQERDKHRERRYEDEKNNHRERRHDDKRDSHGERRHEDERDKHRERRHEDERDKHRERRHEDERDKHRERRHEDERDKYRERRHEDKRDSHRERRHEDKRDSHRERRHEDEQDKHGERRPEKERDRHIDRRKEASRDRRGDREMDEREKRKEKDRLDGNVYGKDSRENRDRRRDRDVKQDWDRDKEKERTREGMIHSEGDRDKRKEDKDKERRREEQDRDRRTERERRRLEESGRVATERNEKGQRDGHRERDRHKDEHAGKRNDKERRERHEDRRQSITDEHRKHKEDRDQRHRDRGYHDEKQKQDSDSRESQRQRGGRERGQGDKCKDSERKQRDKTNSMKSSSLDRGPRHETKEREEPGYSEHPTASVGDAEDTEEPVVNEEETSIQEYEDDFEDYEEDFEEMDENEGEEAKEPEVAIETEELSPQKRAEIKAIQRAMDEENERVRTAYFRPSESVEEEERPKYIRGTENNGSSHRGKFIDFVAAKQREVSKKVASKQKKRSTELLRLIDLDFSRTFSLLDLPPVNEYDMYIRKFGTTNSRQAYVQCNEDNVDRDIQTEEIEVCEKWTQHPSDHNGGCGDPNLSHQARDKATGELRFDSLRLTAFLRSASQVMTVLLEEDQAERESLRKPRTQTDTLSFSDGSLELNTKLPFLLGRQISLVHFSQVQRHTMISVHQPTTKPSTMYLDSCTIICIWNIWEPSRPQKILACQSEVQCCCFSPGKAILVFAGTSVGSVVLWDLREHASSHHRLKADDWTFRQPTFSTDAVCTAHFSSVTSVEVVPSAGTSGPLLTSDEKSSGLSFQLASLDESGVLNFWVVVELPKANEAGSQTDLGLRPGGKVKLLHSSSRLTAERTSAQDAVKTGSIQTLNLRFLPNDSSHFFIGTNMGLVNHGTSHGLKAPPKFYSFQEVAVRPVEISSIDFSPFMQHLFLVGCADGCIRLHAVSHEQPVAEWKSSTAGEAVVSLQWHQTRSTVFCVLDAASTLHIWDLMRSDAEPAVTERMDADRVTAMAVFGDSAQQNTYSGITLAHESGKIEMHYFTRNLTEPVSGEEETLEKMTSEAF